MRIMHAMHILLRCARTTLVTCMRNTAMSETCTAVSRLLQEGVVFNIYSGIIIGVNMPFGIKIGLGPGRGLWAAGRRRPAKGGRRARERACR